jgi:type I restriction enzyme S subunit
VPGCRDEPENPEAYLLTPGDIVISRAGSVGLSYLVKECPRAIFASYLIRFRPVPPIESEFIALFLKSTQYWAAIAEETAGVAIPNVNASKLKEIQIPLPPLAEQKRIVAKVKMLLARVNATRERLAKVPVIIKRLRQAVLAAACSGRLTEEWREEHSVDGAANELLVSIVSKRKVRVKEFGSGSYKDPLQPDNPLLPEVPEEWAVASMDQLTCLATSGSRGWAKYYSDSGPLFIRAQNINTDELRLDDVAHVRLPHNAEGQRTRVYFGDLLVTITGANVTKSALVEIELEEAYVSQHVALVRPVDPSVGKYLFLWTISPLHGRAKLLNDAYGAGKPGLNLDNIKEIVVALPSLTEQREIVRRVEALFKLADAIEKRVAMAAVRAEKLTQAILAKAFRGELVPTEAELARREGRSYEPASVLLARIKAERTSQELFSRRRTA